MNIQRRSFLRYVSMAAAGSATGLGPFGAMNMFAQSGVSDYKALVCIHLDGGNDGNNTIVPFDTAGYQNYANLRGPLSLARNSLLPLSGLSGFALHANLPDVQRLFNSGNAALIANVGTLVTPTTRQQYLSGSAPTPHNLFSHSDQATLWQNSSSDVGGSTGWGGRIADVMLGGNSAPKYPLVTSVAGAHIFCSGANTSYASVIPGNTGSVTCTEKTGCATRLSAAQQMLTFNTGLTLVQADSLMTTNAYNYASVLQEAINSSTTPISTVFPTSNTLADQLKQIAQIIQVRSALGTGRQIFFASLRGFDTHATQLDQHSALLTQLNGAIAAFYQATQELGVSQQVTTFTVSDFGRALQPNSAAGSDHAWGGHHVVVGGAVKGGALYGTYPTLALGGPDDASVNGRWIPTTSVSQYAATLASWFGVADSNLNTILPTLENFKSRNLGFV